MAGYNLTMDGRFNLTADTDVTSLLFFKGESEFDGKTIDIRNVYWSKD